MEDRETQLAELQRRLEDLASSHGVLDAQALEQVRAALQRQIDILIAAEGGATISGDLIGRDQVIHGDVVHGDKVAGPKIQVIVQPAAPPPDMVRGVAPIVVFVSSDDEMAAEREAVHRAIDSLPPLHRPWLVELTSSWRRNSAFVSQYIRRCEIFVMLLGEDLSGYLEEEQQWALENRSAHRLYFAPQGALLSEGVQRFLRAQVTSFSDVDELQELVCCALVGILAADHERYGLSRDDLIRLLGAGLLGLAAIDALLAAILVARILPRRAEPPPPPDKLVVATPQNIRALLAQPDPPRRVWWERAGLELCLVPAGTFQMGTRAEDVRALEREFGEWPWYGDETPRHPLYLDAYYIGRGPVTQAQYARFVRQSGHRVPFRDDEWARPYNWDRARRAPPAGKEEHPVMLVAWEDALAYCRWAGMGLPSEAEWEKAASWDAAAGHKRTFPWGDVWNPGRCNTSEGGRGGTTPVGAYSPQGDGPYGCVDMAGNVWEWTRTLWRRDTSRGPPAEFGYPYDPADGREDLAAGGPRVVRGGSFAAPRVRARCAYRYWYSPGYVWYNYGFRVVVSPISGSGL